MELKPDREDSERPPSKGGMSNRREMLLITADDHASGAPRVVLRTSLSILLVHCDCVEDGALMTGGAAAAANGKRSGQHCREQGRGCRA